MLPTRDGKIIKRAKKSRIKLTPSKKQTREAASAKPDNQTNPETALQKNKETRILNIYLKIYKGLDDFHMPVLKAVRKFTSAERVLYPGSGRHVNVSLFFPNVVYVDSDRKTTNVFTDPEVINWINANKIYKLETKMQSLCVNFSTEFEKPNSFDLVISSNAGFVSDTCKKYCKIGGHFLASDCHLDARKLNLDKNFTLVGVFNDTKQVMETSEEAKRGHFVVKKTGEMLTSDQIEEMTRNRRRVRACALIKSAMFYLFKRIR